MNEILNDGSYKLSKTNWTAYIEKTTKAIIKASPIDREMQKHLIPREKFSRCPKLYGLTKIHKQRVHQTNWQCCKLAKDKCKKIVAGTHIIALKYRMQNTYFSYKYKIHKQTVYACVHSCLQTQSQCKTWVRYVDDIHKMNKGKRRTEMFFSFHQLTIEKDNYKLICYLYN